MPSLNESLIWLGKGGGEGGQTRLLSGDAGHKPLGEVPNPLRGCSHNTPKEVLTAFQGSRSQYPEKVPTPPQGCMSQYPERRPYSPPGLQVTIPWKRFLVLREFRLMVTMAIHQFWVYGAKSACMGAFHPSPKFICVFQLDKSKP